MLGLALLTNFLNLSSCLYINYGTAVVGKGIPNILAEGGCPAKISEELLSQASVVEHQHSGQIPFLVRKTEPRRRKNLLIIIQTLHGALIRL